MRWLITRWRQQRLLAGVATSGSAGYLALAESITANLLAADKPGLVLDIAPLSDNDLAFYCLDVTRAGDNGVLAALLLRALFNGLLQEQLAHQNQRFAGNWGRY
ncbi:response regulator of RpoS [Citrobacter koseri]|uniref:Response regulator of RpoS n=1 Tax=Citrobacter koseri TaxID=545 RepID=A0A2X2YPV3_CITKO|nr:response regulator of RpoS [Citrobacter koseri]